LMAARAVTKEVLAFGPKEETSVKGTALLVLDYQKGLGDLPYAKDAAPRAAAALAAARKAGMPVVFSKVTFRPGYTDVSDWNKVFAAYKAKNLLAPEKSSLIGLFQLAADEVVVAKDRFSAFSGNDLKTVLRAAGSITLFWPAFPPAESSFPPSRKPPTEITK
jgi:nicotinamidase-related amidase